MFGITDFTTYLIGTVVVILLPGPNSLFVLSVASRQGPADGYRAAGGVLVGDGLLMLAAAAGVAPLLAAHALVFSVLRWLGAAYLAWMGIGLLRAAWAGWQHSARGAPPLPPVRVAQPFRRTLLISLSNPKAILFFISFFVQFVDPAYPHPALSFAVLGLSLQLISLAYLSLLILAGHRLAAALRERQRLGAGATGLAGLLFLGFGVRLAGASV
ncbi:MAG TPA: leucine efflux protein LeuE [Nevskiaceae bacterium]|nr:leucine efflux protein LeuE [Nevskiaceae bacterium]